MACFEPLLFVDLHGHISDKGIYLFFIFILFLIVQSYIVILEILRKHRLKLLRKRNLIVSVSEFHIFLTCRFESGNKYS